MASLDILVAIEGIKGIAKAVLGNPDGLTLPDAVQATSWSWGLSHEGNEQRLAGGVANIGRVEPVALTFTKQMDEASPLFLRSALRGAVHKTAELHCYRQINGKNVRYFTLNMEKVLVSSVTPGVEVVEGRIMETIGLRFEIFKSESKIIDDKGTVSKGGEGNFNFVKYE